MSRDELRDEERILAASQESRFLIQYSSISKDMIMIWASRTPTRNHQDIRFAHKLEFAKDLNTGVKRVKCFEISPDDGTEKLIWKMRLPENINLLAFSLYRFKQILQVWCSRSKQVNGLFFRFQQDFFSEQVALLKCEPIEIENCVRTSVERISHLKTFAINGARVVYNGNPSDRYYYTPYHGLSDSAFLELLFSRVNIFIGSIPPEEIYYFCRIWQEGQVRENFEFCIWNLRNSNFDVRRLWIFFNKDPESLEPIIIEHRFKPELIGRLYIKSNELRFFIDDFSRKSESFWTWLLLIIIRPLNNFFDYFFPNKMDF